MSEQGSFTKPRMCPHTQSHHFFGQWRRRLTDKGVLLHAGLNSLHRSAAALKTSAIKQDLDCEGLSDPVRPHQWTTYSPSTPMDNLKFIPGSYRTHMPHAFSSMRASRTRFTPKFLCQVHTPDQAKKLWHRNCQRQGAPRNN